MRRVGRTNRPYYRIVATDVRSPRDGKVIETLGTYDPHAGEPEKQVVLKEDRAKYWVSVGALTSVTVTRLFKKRGLPTHLK
jgi:small subunit ribosomal protein S16